MSIVRGLKVSALAVYGIALMRLDFSSVRWMDFMIFGIAMLLIADIDAAEKMIPNRILCFLVGVRTMILIATYIQDHTLGIETAIQAGLGFAAMSALFGLTRLTFRKRIGMGDVKLMILVGYYVGVKDGTDILVLALFVALFFFAHRAMSRDEENEKQKIQEALSFGPCVAIATILLYVSRAIGTYMS